MEGLNNKKKHCFHGLEEVHRRNSFGCAKFKECCLKAKKLEIKRMNKHEKEVRFQDNL